MHCSCNSTPPCTAAATACPHPRQHLLVQLQQHAPAHSSYNSSNHAPFTTAVTACPYAKQACTWAAATACTHTKQHSHRQLRRQNPMHCSCNSTPPCTAAATACPCTQQLL
eukprot:1158130-Pelagomonas_calceolata.AAC.5